MILAEIQKRITSARVISVDMDGVLIGLFLGRTWLDVPYKHDIVKKVMHNGKSHPIMHFVDHIGTHVGNYFKTELPDAYKVFSLWKSQGKDIYITTARRKGSSAASIKWLTQKGYYPLIKGLEFNNDNVIPKLYKDEVIKRIKADVHIDDNVEIIKHLSETFPEKFFILFSKNHSAHLFGPNVAVISSWDKLLW